MAKNDNPAEVQLVKQIVSSRVDIKDTDDLSACNDVKLPDITTSVTEEGLMSTNGANAEKHSSQH